MFIYTQLYFDKHLSCLIRGWRIYQVLPLKYLLRCAIAPVFALCAGAVHIFVQLPKKIYFGVQRPWGISSKYLVPSGGCGILELSIQ